MPALGVNVCANPNFSDVAGNGEPRYWTRSSWEPVLCCGGGCSDSAQVVSVTAADHVADTWPGVGVGGRYFVGQEGRNDLGLNAGILYGGPGFDAGPGDVWRIQFDYRLGQITDQEDQNTLRVATNPTIFVRYGVTLWNPATSHWDAWYGSLPAAPVLLPSPNDMRSADGPLLHYDVSFTVPAHFPRATLQFAICHPPQAYSQAQWDDPTIWKGFSFPMYVDNVDLRLVAPGGDGDGSAPGESFWAFWPTPRFYPGTPLPDFSVDLEWDQFILNAGFPLQVVRAPLPHYRTLERAYARTPGILEAILFYRDDQLFDEVIEQPADYTSLRFPEGFAWAPSDSVSFSPENAQIASDLTPYTFSLPPTDTLGTFASRPRGWIPNYVHENLLNPIAPVCGRHQAFLAGATYLISGYQEWASSGLFGGTNYDLLDRAFNLFLHPYLRPDDFASAAASATVFGIRDLAIPQLFDFSLRCPGGLRVWQRI